jgi:hypothetical protein
MHTIRTSERVQAFLQGMGSIYDISPIDISTKKMSRRRYNARVLPTPSVHNAWENVGNLLTSSMNLYEQKKSTR